MLRLIFGALIFVGLLVAPASANATRVTPMIVDIKPSGREAVARVQLINDNARDIPFEARVFKGEIDLNGKLTLAPAEEDFLVYPAQILVKQGTRQIIRIQYLGDPALPKSEIYYISIRQVPVEIENIKGAQVQVLVNYNVLVNVVPDGARPDPVVKSIRTIPTSVRQLSDGGGDESEQGSSTQTEDRASNEGAPDSTASSLEVIVGNDGNRYFLAGFSTWRIRGKTKAGADFSTVLDAGDAAKSMGAGVVAPGKERRFVIPVSEELDPASVSIEVEPALKDQD